MDFYNSKAKFAELITVTTFRKLLVKSNEYFKRLRISELKIGGENALSANKFTPSLLDYYNNLRVVIRLGLARGASRGVL